MEVTQKKDLQKYEAFFLDVGISDVVDELQVRNCPVLWKVMSPLAIHCKLDLNLNCPCEQAVESNHVLSFISSNR